MAEKLETATKRKRRNNKSRYLLRFSRFDSVTNRIIFPDRKIRKRYWIIIATLVVLSLLLLYLLTSYANPAEFGSAGYNRIAKLRLKYVLAIAIVAVCQGMATVAFQTVASNRIVTPSILGFDNLYRLIQTALVFYFGAAGIEVLVGLNAFIANALLMIVFAGLIYGWMLSGRYANVQIMLLVGIILGTAIGSISTLMQRLLDSSEYDLLLARLIGSIAKADLQYIYISLPFLAFTVVCLWLKAPTLDAISLGKDMATNAGINLKRQRILILFLVSIMSAISTALVGPMTFFGFLAAMLSYQLSDTYSHRHIFLMVCLVGFVFLCACYFILKHLFYAEGSVNVIIEFLGGAFFLAYILKKGRL